MVAGYGYVQNPKKCAITRLNPQKELQVQNPHRPPDHNPSQRMSTKKPKPLTHAEFSSRGGKANTPKQNAARAANSLSRAAKIKAERAQSK